MKPDCCGHWSVYYQLANPYRIFSLAGEQLRLLN